MHRRASWDPEAPQAPGCATHSGRAAGLRSAPWEASTNCCRAALGPPALRPPAEAASSAALYLQVDLVQLVDELVGLSHEEGTPNTHRHI